MIFTAKKQKNKIDIANKEKFEKYLATLPDDCYLEVKIEKRKNKRTITQNKALYLWFGLLAEKLNESGFDMKKTLKESIDIPWNAENVKKYLWQPIQKAHCLTDSTTKLTTKDIDIVYDIVNRAIGERTGVSVSFPSRDDVRL